MYDIYFSEQKDYEFLYLNGGEYKWNYVERVNTIQSSSQIYLK